MVHDALLEVGIRNLIFVREIDHSLPPVFESLPSKNNVLVLLSKYLGRISYTTLYLVLRESKVRE